MKPCSHQNRDQAVSCPYYRANKADRVGLLHGPNHFAVKLSRSQENILGFLIVKRGDSLNLSAIFALVDEADYIAFMADVIALEAEGLVTLTMNSDGVFLSADQDGVNHVDQQLRAIGSSLGHLRLLCQSGEPGYFELDPIPFVDRISSFLNDRKFNREMEVLRSYVGPVQ